MDPHIRHRRPPRHGQTSPRSGRTEPLAQALSGWEQRPCLSPVLVPTVGLFFGFLKEVYLLSTQLQPGQNNDLSDSGRKIIHPTISRVSFPAGVSGGT